MSSRLCSLNLEGRLIAASVIPKIKAKPSNSHIKDMKAGTSGFLKSEIGITPRAYNIQGQSEFGDLYLCLKANPFGRELQYKFIESP